MTDDSDKLKVFISYSRRDAAQFADELVAGLELAGFAPFLDRHDIAAGEDWEARLGGLIAQSDTVVFVVSPESVKSERCVWEVDRTLANSKRLLPVVYKPVPDNEIPQALSRLQFVRFDTGRALTRSIAELAEALRLDLDWIREHTRIGELAARWTSRGKPESLLLRGDELDAAKQWAGKRKAAAPEITETQRGFLLASDEAENARLGKERAQLDEMARAQTATARQQRRAGRLLWSIAILMLGMIGYVTWQSYEVARREMAVFTSLAVQAMNEGQYDRAMRFALQAFPARGHIPGLTPFSTELEGKLAGGAQSSQLHRVLRGHTLEVHASFSPDGTKAVTDSEDGTARVWDARSGMELLLFKITDKPTAILSAVFTPDGKGVLMGMGDGTARIWDATDGKELMVFKGHEGPVTRAIYDFDGKRIATVSRDKTVRVWDAASGRELAVLKGHAGEPERASFSASGSRLVTVSREDSSARVWDIDTAQQLMMVKSNDAVMWEAALDLDGKRLVTTDLLAGAKIWDVDSSTELFELKDGADPLDFAAYQVIFSRDGKRLLTEGGHTVLLWDVTTGKVVKTFKMPAESRVSQVIVDRNETRIATASDDRIIRVWDVASGEAIASFTGHTKPVASLAFSPAGKWLVSGSVDATARIWLVEGAIAVTLKAPDGSAITTHYAAFSPDGHRAVTASSDKAAYIWDAETGRQLRRLEGHTETVWKAVFSPDGKSVATAGDRTVRLWNAETGELIRTFEGHTDTVWAVAFEPAGRGIVSAGRDSTARLWRIDTGEEIGKVDHDGWIRSAAFSPDGRHVVTAIDRGRAYVWDPQDLKHFVVLEGHTNGVTDAQFDHTGKRVVTASGDGTVRIWDSASGKELARLQNAKGAGLQSAQFSPDERLVVAYAINGSAIVWDVASGQEIVTLQVEGGGFFGSAAFSPDGTRVMVANGSKPTRIWDVSWAANVRGEMLRERVCSEKLVGVAQEFTDIELANPILRSIDKDDPIARNPCLRRGPLSWEYWTRLPGELWRSGRKLWAAY